MSFMQPTMMLRIVFARIMHVEIKKESKFQKHYLVDGKIISFLQMAINLYSIVDSSVLTQSTPMN